MAEPDVPHRRLRLRLDLEADALDDIVAALERVAFDLELAEQETAERDSGGSAHGFHYTLTCDTQQTGDRFREQLREWHQSRKIIDDGSLGG